MSGFTRLAALAAVLAAPAAALAAGKGDVDPLDALQAVAKAKFDASQRTPADRARDLAETAREGYAVTYQMHLDGKTTPEYVWVWSSRVLESELALLDKDADPAPLYKRFWRDMRESEKIVKTRFEAGKAWPGDLTAARYQSLQAEIAWLAHRGREGKKPYPTAVVNPLAEYRENTARIQAEATEAAPRELAQASLEAARHVASIMENLPAPPDIVLLWVLRVRDAELALLNKGDDPTPALQECWETSRRIEEIAEERQKARGMNGSDLHTCYCYRLEAEIAWLGVRKGLDAPAGRKTAAAINVAHDDPVETAGRARMLFEASNADIQQLLRDRLLAARAARDANKEDFRAGKVGTSLPLESSLRWLEADRAVAASPKEEAAAVERYWRRALDLEAMAEEKARAGKIATADVLATRYARFQAEAWMAQGMGKREAK